MIMEYSRCDIGKRCIIKTNDNLVFKKFTLLSAISNKKCLGWILYKKGGSTKERFVEFLQNIIFQKYKNHLLVLDNAIAHNNNLVKQAIIDSGNKYLFTVPYTPKTNAIEMWFNQIKHTLKLNKKVLKFNELKLEVKKSIRKVKIPKDCAFLLGDQDGISKKELKKLKKFLTPVSIGPHVYFASQTVAVVNNELDLRGI
jgi:transposase